ncbi:MAG: ribonuclease III [Bacteroidota bacterium]
MFGSFFHRIIGLFKQNKHISDKQLHILIQIRIRQLEKILQYQIVNQSYYIKAITHRSFIELYPDILKSNQRLEFFGDSVINMIVAQYLFYNFPEEEEGFLTKARASLVNKERLYEAAKELKLDEVILYNAKYLKDTVLGLQSILADAYEALTGAIFLDKGLKKAEEFVHKSVIEPSEDDESFLADKNYKGQLLEYTHAHRLQSPRYIIRKEVGPAHMKEFTIEVFISDESYGFGSGNSKKIAEQNASKTALEKLNSL